MNPPPPTSPPLLPALTAPNKTLLTSDKHSFRRPSLYQNNSSSPLSPSSPPYLQQSPTSELADSFSSIGAAAISRSSSNLSTGSKPLPSLPSTTTPANLYTGSSIITSPPQQKITSQYFSNTQTLALKTLCSAGTVDSMDNTFWSSLLNHRRVTATHTPQDAFDLEMDTVGLSIELAANNIRTQNFNKLVLHLLSQLVLLQEAEPSIAIPTCTYNALFLVRVFSKHFVGNLTNAEITDQFESK
ncbi:hypothetical protein BC941DRAFT_157949 [Chlamydoabsidia padenii]|nr:hypothetical protein BC941DRAFT_157949 [Chlamydoabsidia padenii]